VLHREAQEVTGSSYGAAGSLWPAIDVNVAHSARIRSYLLGGKDKLLVGRVRWPRRPSGREAVSRL